MKKIFGLAGLTLAFGTAVAAAQQDAPGTEVAGEPASGQTAEDVSANYAPGLEAEIYVVAKAGEIKNASERPAKPSGVPLGIIVDSDAPLLNYNIFQRDESMASYHGQNILGVLWKGYLNIKDEGLHIISVSDYKVFVWDGCSVRVWVNGNEALKLDYQGGDHDQTYTDQNAFELSSGLYEIGAWKICVGNDGGVIRDESLEKSRLTLFMKSPSQQKIEPIDAALLVHEVE